MTRIGVVGISWRHHRADILADFTIPREQRRRRLPDIAASLGVPELVYVATCNRVEVAFATDGRGSFNEYRRCVFAALAGREPRAGEAEHTLRIWQGEGAAEHLFLVAAGLDSARIGESEITGQVREAAEVARELGLIGQRLDPVFVAALRVAKRVRPVTEGRIGRVSLAEVAVRRVRERLSRTPGAVALVGLSPMITHCARALAERDVPLVIVNRTPARVAELVAEVRAVARSLDDFRRAPDAVEALVIATGAKTPLFGRPELERLAARALSGEAPLVVDLAVPPNVSPEDAAASDVPRVGMDEITDEASVDRERLLPEFADARAIVDTALTELRHRTAEGLVSPMIAELQRRYRRTAMEGVARLFQHNLAGLGEQERDAVERWAETLARRFAHLTSIGLRELAFQLGPASVEVFFSATDPQLARALRDAAERAGAASSADLEVTEP